MMRWSFALRALGVLTLGIAISAGSAVADPLTLTNGPILLSDGRVIASITFADVSPGFSSPPGGQFWLGIEANSGNGLVGTISIEDTGGVLTQYDLFVPSIPGFPGFFFSPSLLFSRTPFTAEPFLQGTDPFQFTMGPDNIPIAITNSRIEGIAADVSGGFQWVIPAGGTWTFQYLSGDVENVEDIVLTPPVVTPVPESSSLALIVMGLAAAGLFRRSIRGKAPLSMVRSPLVD